MYADERRHNDKTSSQSCISKLYTCIYSMVCQGSSQDFSKIVGHFLCGLPTICEAMVWGLGPSQGPRKFLDFRCSQLHFRAFPGLFKYLFSGKQNRLIFFILDIDISTNDQFSFMDFYYELCDKKIKVGRCYCNRNIGKAGLAIFF